MEFLQKYSDAMGLSSDIVILIVMAALLYLVIGLVLGLRRAGKKIGETVQLSREEKLIPEKTALIQAGNASPVSPAGIVRRELKLENSALFSFPEFRRRTDQILSSAADYYRKLLPFFHAGRRGIPPVRARDQGDPRF